MTTPPKDPTPSQPKTAKPKGNTRGLLKRISTVQKTAYKRAPGRPTADEGDKLREWLIITALNSFMQRGFEGVSVESIARDAKLAKITIYRQFGDKKALFLEAVSHAQRSVRGQLMESIDLEGAPDEVLRNIIRRLRDVTSHPDYLAVLRLVISEAPRFPETGEAFLQQTDYATGPIVAYLDRLSDEGVISVENTHHAALQLGVLAMGGVRYLMHTPSNDAVGKERWVEEVFMLCARAWGMVPVVTPKRLRKKSPKSKTPAADSTL
ncbi:MAG: TetR/AcrR family transcriptional regulator [Pseudomonadota bacterium]